MMNCVCLYYNENESENIKKHLLLLFRISVLLILELDIMVFHLIEENR